MNEWYDVKAKGYRAIITSIIANFIVLGVKVAFGTLIAVVVFRSCAI